MDTVLGAGMIPSGSPALNLSAGPGDARNAGGQLMPASVPYGMRQQTSSLILAADGSPYRTSGKNAQKGDDRTYIDIHNLNPYQKVITRCLLRLLITQTTQAPLYKT